MSESGPLYDDLAAARDATRRLLIHLDELPVEDLRAPSLLPGWSRAHVVAHLAGNALSHVRMLDGCLAGEVRAQYADGGARADGIAALAAVPARVVAEHARAAAALEDRWAAMRQEHWERPVRWLDRGTAPAHTTLWSRRKEVEVHRVDLAAGYAPADWPAEFARRLLARLLARTDLPTMVVVADGVPTGEEGVGTGEEGPRVSGSPAALAAWLSGRSDGADLQVSGGPLPTPPAWG